MERVFDNCDIEWCASQDLSPIELHIAAGWIQALDMDFYDLFQLGEANTKQLIAQLLCDSSSEFGPTVFVRHAGVLAGLVTWFAAHEIFTRRIFVLRELLAASTDASSIKPRLRSFEGASRKVPPDALYLSKIYVAPEKRGEGIGARLFARYLDVSKAAGRKPILHVRRDNANAMAFYSARGFKVTQMEEKIGNPYYLMTRL